MADRKHTDLTDRGFARYGNGACTYGIAWRVTESSAVGEPHTWLFVDGMTDGGGTCAERTMRGALHLSIDQASALKDALQKFIDDAADPENWRNHPDYIAQWRKPEPEPNKV